MGKKERKAAFVALENRVQESVAPALGLIERAFDGVPPPDHEHRTLHQAEAWDSYKTIDQRRDHKGRWQELPESHIRECTQALPHLDEQGVLYYLPPLMSHFIKTPRARELQSYESLLSMLRPGTGDLKLYQQRRLSLLTLVQREAIVAYLERIGAPEEDLLPWRRVLGVGDDADWFRKFY